MFYPDSDPAAKQLLLYLSHHVFYLDSDPAMKQFLLYLDESNALGAVGRQLLLLFPGL